MANTVDKKIDLDWFMSTFDGVLEAILASVPVETKDELSNYISDVRHGGKMTRGITVALTVKEIRQAGLDKIPCTEIQACFLVADDVMDESDMRRGKPCWYKLPSVGSIAVNESYLLERYVYVVLKYYFKNYPAYHQLVDLFHEVSLRTEYGQEIDMMSTRTNARNNCDFSHYDMKRFRAIVKYKTAFYSFYLPVALGMAYCGLASDSALSAVEPVLMALGELFQAQDDYLDVFGDYVKMGKVGTDIQEAKCSWMAVTALNLCNDAQRQVFVVRGGVVHVSSCQSNYGKSDADSVTKIRSLYQELDLKSLYYKYEDDAVARISDMIKELPTKIMTFLLNKIAKRDS